jgi:hypothetical protein
VFVQGHVENEPDFGSKLLRSLDVTSIEMTDPKEAVNIDFRAVPPDFEFLPKKVNKEHINLDGPPISLLDNPPFCVIIVSYRIDAGKLDF